MIKPLKRTQVLILAGVLIAFGLLLLTVKVLRCPHYGRWLVQRILLEKEPIGSRVRPQWFLAYTALPPKGSKGASLVDGYRYQSSDCVEVTIETYSFESSGDAEQEMRRRLQDNYRVYEHTTKAGDANLPVIERAVIQATPGADYFILRRRESRISAIASESLPHALEYERTWAK